MLLFTGFSPGWEICASKGLGNSILDAMSESQRDTAGLKIPTEAVASKSKYLKEKLAKLRSEMRRSEAYEKQMFARPDQ